MARKIHCAASGLGRLEWPRAGNLATPIPGATLTAVVDVMEDRAAAFARQYAIPIYTSGVEAVPYHPDIEAVVITTPRTMPAFLVQMAIVAKKLYLLSDH